MSEKKLDLEQQRVMRVYRANENLTLSALANRIGVAVSCVSSWERGATAPRGLYRVALARLIPELKL